MKKNFFTILPLILFSALAILFASQLLKPRVNGYVESPLIGKTLPDLGVTIPGSPFIVNFFASWCAPCLVEHPHLMAMKKNGTAIIGIVFKDTPESIEAFLKKHGNPYSAIVYDDGSGPSIAMGITGVPESYAIDRNRIIRLRNQGPLEDPATIKQFMKALNHP